MAYWIVSAPGKDQTWQQLKKRTSDDEDLSVNWRMNIPVAEMRVGTMDTLMTLGDEIPKVDMQVEQVMRQLQQQLVSLQKNNDEPITINGKPVENFLTSFTWDTKYKKNVPLNQIVDKIFQDVQETHDELRKRAAEYNAVKGQLSQIERQDKGNLAVKSLDNLVKKEHVVETENLTTLFVVVPTAQAKEWESTYERMLEKPNFNPIVPRSSVKISQDNDFALYNVVMFNRWVDDFKNEARQKRINVREFTFDEDAGKHSSDEKRDLMTSEKKLWASLAIRVFVESVLRYGLPPNFQAMVMQPKRKKEEKLRKALNELYSNLAGADLFGQEDDAHEKYYPYVYVEVDFSER